MGPELAETMEMGAQEVIALVWKLFQRFESTQLVLSFLPTGELTLLVLVPSLAFYKQSFISETGDAWFLVTEVVGWKVLGWWGIWSRVRF